MNKFSRVLGAAAAAVALAACAGPRAGAQVNETSFSLVPHQSVPIAPGATLTYDSVSDSRCPPGMKCIWAGKLSYQFRLQSGNTVETFALGPDQPTYTSPALGGARIELDKAAIPPPAKAQAEPEAQSVTLRVSRP
jgi:hypothetical protein